MDLLYANDTKGQYPDSYWASVATPLEPLAPLAGSVRADVCVIGAGFTGLSSALHLAKAGYDVVLLEAQRVGFGASGRNGGQVGTGQRVDQDELEKMLGADHARIMWDLGEASKDCVRDLIRTHNIDCDWRDGIIHAELRPRNLHHSVEYADMLNSRYGYPHIRALDGAGIRNELGTDAYCGGTIDMGAGHLNPQKYVLGLARAALDAGVRIFEGSKVVKVDQGEPALVHTDNGQVSAAFVVLAGNGYQGDLVPAVSARIMPINNFIIATEPLGDLAVELIRQDVAVADSKFVVNYFKRSPDGRMVFGGGESYGYRFPSDIAAKARAPMLRIFPQLEEAAIDYAWGGTLAITVNRMPSFQRVTPNILSAAGFSGHGVAMASLAGQVLSEAVRGTAERFEHFARVKTPRFPGGKWARAPLLALAMTWFSFRDRL